MMKIGINTLVMAICWVLVTGAGVYFTFFEQPEELEHLEKAEQVAQMKHAELASLRTEEASLSQMSDDVARKWRARYKVIPEELTTADVVGYLNELTSSGFKNFDIAFGGRQRSADFSYYVFNISGRAYYNDLYKLIWELENSRSFYRLHNLSLDHIDLVSEDKELGTNRLQVMVSFTGRLEAYFDGIDGASAPEVLDASLYENQGVPVARQEDLPPVPLELLPDVSPAKNPFYPVILEQIPPNTYGHVDVETAELISIVGQKAVFKDDTGLRTVGLGEDVYLGTLSEVNPADGRVVARLNKGGIYDEVVLELDTGEPFRHAQGPAQLSPLN